MRLLHFIGIDDRIAMNAIYKTEGVKHKSAAQQQLIKMKQHLTKSTWEDNVSKGAEAMGMVAR